MPPLVTPMSVTPTVVGDRTKGTAYPHPPVFILGGPGPSTFTFQIRLSNTISFGSIVTVIHLIKKCHVLLTCACTPHFQKGSSTTAYNH